MRDETESFSSDHRLLSWPLFRVAVCLMVGIALGLEDESRLFVVLMGWDGMLTAISLLAISSVLFIRYWRFAATMTLLCWVVLIGWWWAAIRSAPHTHESLKVSGRAVVVGVSSVRGDTLTATLFLMESDRQPIAHPLWIRARFIGVDRQSDALSPGSVVSLWGRLRGFSSRSSTGFDYVRWARSQGYDYAMTLYPGNWSPTSSTGLSESLPWGLGLRLHGERLRSHLSARFLHPLLSDESRSILMAMTLGDKRLLSPHTRRSFTEAGVSHLLALSGLHLAILFSSLMLFVRWLRRRWGRRRQTDMLSLLLTMVMVWAYVLLTGMPMGVVRAATMVSFCGATELIVGHRFSGNGLSLAAIVILLFDPLSLWDVSFQLSFAGVASIFLFYPPLASLGYRFLTRFRLFATSPHSHWSGRWLMRLCRGSWGLVAVTLATQLGVTPLVLYHFGTFPIWFVLGNVLVVPLITFILYLGLAMLVNPFDFLTSVLARILDVSLGLVMQFLDSIGRLPLSDSGTHYLNGIQVLLSYLFIAVLMALYPYWQSYRRGAHTLSVIRRGQS